MENFISEEYFLKLDELLNSAKEEILSGKATNLNALFQLLNALPLNIILNGLDLEEFAKSLQGNKDYTSFKGPIIMNAIKNLQLRSYKYEVFDFKNMSAFYFLNRTNGNEIERNLGVACKGIEFSGEDFYDNCTIADEPIAENWEPIKNSVPPVNAMLVIDKYIFDKPFEKKIQNLIEFIKLYKNNLQIPFHLTILFSLNQGDQNLINKAFRLLSEIGNMEVQLYADHNLPSSDRLFFTNYTSGNIGHPFDARPTRFTQNFLGRNNSIERIRNNYKNYRTDLLKWDLVIKKIPQKFGIMQSKWESSIFTNRLFEPVLDL